MDVGKTFAFDAGKKLVEKAAKRLSAPKLQVANVMIPPEEITKKVNDLIAMNVQDVFTHHSESYLIFESCVAKADSTPYANADEVALTNNAIMYFFAELNITYQTS